NTLSAIGDLQMFPVQTNSTFAAACLCAFLLCKLTPNDIPNIPGINQKDTQSQRRWGWCTCLVKGDMSEEGFAYSAALLRPFLPNRADFGGLSHRVIEG